MNTQNLNLIELKEQLLELLPHGSGINFEWLIIESKNFIDCFNSYECMNEAGYYTSVEPFRLRINKNDLDKWRVTFENKYRYWIDSQMLKPYLEDIFAESISDLKKWILDKYSWELQQDLAENESI